MYPCQKCSACCRLVGRVVLGEKMADADGVCHFLDRTTNLCTQYENRPIFCNVDKFYERYYVDNMTYDSNCYEIADGNGKILIDNLSLSQLIALSNML